MKTPKSDQLAQNIKSTCSKLQQEMEDKPYIRPGSGKAKIFNSLTELIELKSSDWQDLNCEHSFSNYIQNHKKCDNCGKIEPII